MYTLDDCYRVHLSTRQPFRPTHAPYCTPQPTTANYAVPGKPGSMHGILAMMNTRLYPFWDGLEDALRTNRPQNESKHAGEGGGDPFEAFKNDAQAVEQFAAAMEGASHGVWWGV